MDQDILFGEWVRRRRKALDLTQEALADAVGCSLSAIRKIERDERHPSRQVAELLATALHINEEDRPRFLRAARTGLFADQPSQRPPTPLPTTPIPQPAQPVQVPVQLPSVVIPVMIPAVATPLVGRAAELAQIATLLADSQCRLLTIVGVGGAGKTRLAIQAAREYAETHTVGATFVALAAVTAPEDVPSTIASTLRVRLQAQRDPQTQLVQELADKRWLLVLDNLEHLLAPAADDHALQWLVDLLEAAPGVKLLTTSREQLNLPGEWLFDLQGLPTPTTAAVSATDEESAPSSAAALFLQTARRTSVTFQPTELDAAAIARICRLVDGLPLALELAASWVRTLTPTEIADEIEQSIDFLATSARSVPERHRSITAVFHHSWQLLSSDEQTALRRLSVFRGGFGREAAQAIAAASLPLLSALVTKSLLRRSERARYELHELVRQYAQSQLTAVGEADTANAAHLHYFVRLAEQAREALYGVDQVRWLEQLEREHDNLRAALTWAFDPDRSDGGHAAVAAMQLVVDLTRFWNGRGYLAEGCRWIERGLPCLPASALALRGHALNLWAWLLHQRGERAQAKTLQLEALALFRQANDPAGMADALDVLGDIAWGERHFDEARTYYEEELALRRSLNDASGEGLVLYSLGRLHVDHGDPGAGPLLAEALTRLRQVGDRRGVALTLNALGRAAINEGRHSEADWYVREALTIFGELGNQVDIAECLEELAFLAEVAGDWPRVATLLGAAKAVRMLVGVEYSLDQARIDHLTHTVHQDATLRTAWQSGQRLSVAQAVALA
jgi:predicted ATPase/transcriptional regulator with XRE-family HTH domain